LRIPVARHRIRAFRRRQSFALGRVYPRLRILICDSPPGGFSSGGDYGNVRDVSQTRRASLSPELQSLRPRLRALVPRLESLPGCYGSVYLERETGKTYTADFKRTHLSDSR